MCKSTLIGVSKGLTTDKNIFNTTSNEALRTQAEFKIKSAEKIIKDIKKNFKTHKAQGISK